MRLISTLAFVALAASPIAAMAQAPAPAAPAPAAAAKPTYTSATKLGVLLANDAAKAVVFKAVPELAQAGDQLSQAGDFTLKDLQQYIPTVTDKVLADIDAELAKIK